MNTHTIQDIEGLMFDYQERLQKAETKTEKLAIAKKLKSLEQHYNSIQEKNINGKKYPVKKKPVDISKSELLKLIDSVETPDPEGFNQDTVKLNSYVDLGLDESGVSVGKNRFSFVELD